MGPLRALLMISGTFVGLAGACGGTSDAPPHTSGGLDCLASPLTSYCCSTSGPVPCVGDFVSATKCATWPSGAKVKVYPSACHGLVAVGVTLKGSSYASFYVYEAASSSLYALGDDAATNQPGSLQIECGAGPAGFAMPSDCGVAWLDPTKGSACAAGSSTPTSVCH